MKNKKQILLLVVALLIFGSGAGCGKKTTTDKNKPVDTPAEEINLSMWGIYDDSSVFQPLIEEFNKANPNIKVSYTKKEYADYEKLLVDSIAGDEGPDIFTIHNDWLPKHRAKLYPAPEDIISLESYKDTFVDSAFQDLTADGKIYAVPLYTDNLALFYNKDIFRKNRIYNAPETWNDLIQIAKLLTKTAPGNPNQITEGGIALGTADNVVRANDILLTIMMQTETPIISDDKRSFNFNQFRKNPDGTPYYPGEEALKFYTAFADPTKQAYSWSVSMDNAIHAFANGKVAMVLGYSYFTPMIEKLNPTLSFATTKMPQVIGADSDTTLANYWAWGVSKDSQNKDAAWGFLEFLSQERASNKYLNATKKVSAHKESSSGTEIFGKQKDSAKTIYKGNSDEFDKIFTDMINDVVKYKQPYRTAIDTAARNANEMLKKYY